jgi:hypothetical protein
VPVDLRVPEKRMQTATAHEVPEIRRKDLLGGLIHEYETVAA